MTADVTLVEAMARGDSAALAQLYDRYAPSMLGLARRIVSRSEAAEDLVHEVFLEAWEHASTYDDSRGTVKAWLMMRTRSRSIDYRRAADQSRATLVNDSFWTEQLSRPATDESLLPDHAVIRSELLNLPKDQRDALLLGYFEGLSTTEIAQRVGSPVGTVKTRVAAALSKLRGALIEEGRGEQ
jgi:RNA polymerase sigma-70 factor (ECF subfamily)